MAFGLPAVFSLAQPALAQPPGATVSQAEPPAGLERELAGAIEALRQARASGGLPLAWRRAADLVEAAARASRGGTELAEAELALADSAFEMADSKAALLQLASARKRLGALEADHNLRLRLANVELRGLAEAGRLAEAHSARLVLREQLRRNGYEEAETALENENYLAALLGNLGRPKEALAALLFLAGKVRARSDLGSTLKYDIDSNLVIALAQSGRIDEARQLATRNLESIRASFGEHGLVFATQAARVALVEIYGGNPAAARPAAELAVLRTADELGDDALPTVQALELLTFVAARLARVDEALMTQQKVVDSLQSRLGAEHPRTLLAEGNLAAWQMAEGRVADALPTLRGIAARTAANEGPDGNTAIGAELDYVEALFVDGQIAEACSRVESLHMRLVSGPRRTEAAYRLAHCRIEAGRLADARRGLEAVIASRTSEAGANSSGVVDAYAALARVELAAGDEAAALRALERLYGLVEAERLNDSPAPGSGRALFARRVANRERLAGYRDLAALYARSGRVVDAIRIAEQARGRAINDALSMQRYAGDASVPQGVRLRLREADLVVRSLDGRLALSPSGSLEQVRLSQARSIAAAERDRIAQMLGNSVTERSGEESRASLRALRHDEAVVGFQWAPDHAWAYVLRKNAAPEVVLLDPSLAGSAIMALRARLATPAMRFPIWRKITGEYAIGLSAPEASAVRVEMRALLGDLHRALIEPLRTKLVGARRLVVIADGPLTGFPFEVLERDGRPVGRDFEVRYAASLAAYRHASGLTQRPVSPGSRQLLAIGAPDYAALGEAGPAMLRGRRWTGLPGAAAEVAFIAAQFPAAKRTVLLGPEATREQLLTVLGRRTRPVGGFVHVAAHAYLSADAPQWSSLVLGSENRDGPGYVTAAELAAYDIDAELVTLSACETALGREIPGEGVFGLPYALAVAGARATVLTLWPVADESTAAFMKRFYAKLARGHRPAAALAGTKREFMSHPRWSDPFYWAPFVVHGAG